MAQLHLASFIEPVKIAQATNDGIGELVGYFDVDRRKNVDFTSDDYRSYAARERKSSLQRRLPQR